VVKFFTMLAEGFDLVSGSRYLPESKVIGTPPGQRRQINECVTSKLNSMTGWSLTDAFCGFKGYRVDALSKLHLTELGYGFPLQLWIQAFRANFRIVELAVPRVYLNVERTFGEQLDDPTNRLQYYRRVIEDEWGKQTDCQGFGNECE
ncbi:MAG: hypothetical protein KDD64_09120, partial [Bdellovibrionales bacterium]|nr:hypothetical protein [Bdellovibrionales bacterium]